MKKSSTQESQTYQGMLEAVERIVAQVSSDDLDLDQMVAEVEKGYSMIKAMRSRLDETRGKIEKLRLEYDDEKQEP